MKQAYFSSINEPPAAGDDARHHRAAEIDFAHLHRAATSDKRNLRSRNQRRQKLLARHLKRADGAEDGAGGDLEALSCMEGCRQTKSWHTAKHDDGPAAQWRSMK